ncbi:MAG: hypothetical protein PHF67_02075 [Candidatus Nanoarchaeia archaeon]|nr:hypothetical protein [Candidatus Nanoarchaeia archaeon]
MANLTPVEIIKRKIRGRDLHDYIQSKCCSDLTGIYYIDVSAEFGEDFKGSVVAPDAETAVYYFFSRIRWDWESEFNRFYKKHEDDGGIGKFAKSTGRFG